MKSEGLIISLEGLPCSGATRQANLLYTWLDDRDIETLQVRTPGATSLGREINHILYDRPDIRSHLIPQAEIWLMQADLAQAYAETVLPGIEHSKFLVLQEGGHLNILARASLYKDSDAELLTIATSNNIATQGRTPDLTIILDCKPETIQKRAWNCARYHPYVLHELNLMRDFFFVQAQLNPDNVKVVNGENSLEAVFNDILFYIKPLLRERENDIDQQ